jgi:hypothetical protein
MRDTEFDQFSAMLDDVAALLPPSQPLTGTARAMYFRALATVPLERVRAAFDAHVRDATRGRFFPRPADVIAQLLDADGRPGADEAWAVVVRAGDERATVVWTEEMAEAWAQAESVMRIGDEVGARVAFRDAYNRLVAEARSVSRPARWTQSLGHDPEGRDGPLLEAAQKGRITHQLEAPKSAGLLPLLQSKDAPEAVKAKLAELRERLTKSATPTTTEPSRSIGPFNPIPADALPPAMRSDA